MGTLRMHHAVMAIVAVVIAVALLLNFYLW